MNQYHANLDIAEKRLKVAAAVGGVVDISNEPVAHDIRIVAKPILTEMPLADAQRVRDNLGRPALRAGRSAFRPRRIDSRRRASEGTR